MNKDYLLTYLLTEIFLSTFCVCAYRQNQRGVQNDANVACISVLVSVISIEQSGKMRMRKSQIRAVPPLPV